MKNVIMMLALLITLLSGCSSTGVQAGGERKTEIIVFAAASLTEVFGEIKESYEAVNSDVEIIYNFAGSQVLASQIEEGAKPAMFFSANEKYVNQLMASGVNPWQVEGLDLDKRLFATNRLVLIYSDEYEIASLEGGVMLLEEEGKKPVILALEEVPVGKYTKKMMECYLEITGDQQGYDSFYSQVVSYESDVKAVVAKVRIHEGDIGVVYRTDAASVDLEANGLKYLDIADTYNQTATYGSLIFTYDSAASEFYDYITEGDGQEILRDNGF